MGTIEEVFYRSRHPYTLGLLASLPRVDKGTRELRLHRIKGQPPSLIHVPPGCPFHPRCELARLPDPCATEVPAFRAIERMDHRAACHFAEDLRELSPEVLQYQATVEATQGGAE